MKFIKKPITVEAIRLGSNKEDVKEILSWSNKKRPIVIVWEGETLKYAEITTLEGVMRAEPGDWIIKGVEDEVYPCKDSVFVKTYNLLTT